MAEGGFDACECIFSQEAAMRRLLSMLRNSQTSCTDSDCTQDFTGPDGVGGLFGGSNMMYTIMMMWAVAAVALFFMRPASMRRGGDRKPPPDTDSNSGNDPAPPVQ